MDTKTFIVPHDFTSVGDIALKYALFLAKDENISIMLLHILTHEEKREIAENQFKDLIGNLDLKVGGVSVKYRVEEGNIFDDIPRIAEEENAQLIIMGTHGAIGMQKLFGSYAMKVVTNTYIPFLVVQDEIKDFKLDNIVIPITISKESLQIISEAIMFSKRHNCKLHVISEYSSDEGLRQKIEIRFRVVKKQFEDYDVDGTVEMIKSNKSYTKAIIEYAKNNNCDLIAATHYSDRLFPQFERFTQYLITNKENIPCLVINAKLMTKLSY